MSQEQEIKELKDKVRELQEIINSRVLGLTVAEPVKGPIELIK